MFSSFDNFAFTFIYLSLYGIHGGSISMNSEHEEHIEKLSLPSEIDVSHVTYVFGVNHLSLSHITDSQ